VLDLINYNIAEVLNMRKDSEGRNRGDVLDPSLMPAIPSII
jgi:hypothetical protein